MFCICLRYNLKIKDWTQRSCVCGEINTLNHTPQPYLQERWLSQYAPQLTGSICNPLEREFLDVRVYHAQAPSNMNLKTIPRMYSHHEEKKNRAYNARIHEVERGVFTLKPYSGCNINVSRVIVIYVSRVIVMYPV